MTRIDIENEFVNVSGINEAKKVYKTLAKRLHPDVGGSEEEFKILNAVYTDFIEHKIYFSSESQIDLELEKIISQILHFEDITIELIGSWIWISGNTKEVKDKLKELNFKWASKRRCGITEKWKDETLNKNLWMRLKESMVVKFIKIKVKKK